MRLTRLRADSRGTPTARVRQCRMSKERTRGEWDWGVENKNTHNTQKSIWINKSSVNPKSTSNQSSKPCTVLQYPWRRVNPVRCCSTHQEKHYSIGTATHCNMLQHADAARPPTWYAWTATATYRNILEHTQAATNCNTVMQPGILLDMRDTTHPHLIFLDSDDSSIFNTCDSEALMMSTWHLTVSCSIIFVRVTLYESPSPSACANMYVFACVQVCACVFCGIHKRRMKQWFGEKAYTLFGVIWHKSPIHSKWLIAFLFGGWLLWDFFFGNHYPWSRQHYTIISKIVLNANISVVEKVLSRPRQMITFLKKDPTAETAHWITKKHLFLGHFPNLHGRAKC